MDVGQGDISPIGMAFGADLMTGGGSEEMATWTEMVANFAERSQEALCMLGGFEALQYRFPFTCRQIGVLCPVVQTLVSSMLGVRQYPPTRGRIACELVGDYDLWL